MIEIIHLTKRFSNGRGIHDITLTISEGQALGYLGPNGAGKTTTIRHLLGFLKADAGRAMIQGFDCFTETESIHSKIGYLPGEVALLDEMTGASFLAFMADLRGLKDRSRMKRLIEQFQFDPSVKIHKMSKGMKQKVAIVAAFMHDPHVYILDEPTSGLDPLMQQTFVDLMVEERLRGKTVLLSSHMFSEVERICDRIAIVRDGSLVDVETIEEVRKRQKRRFEVEFKEKIDPKQFTMLGAVLEQHGNRMTVEVQDLNEFIHTLSSYEVLSLASKDVDLEELFLSYYDRRKEAALA